jgi:predicted membrane protein
VAISLSPVLPDISLLLPEKRYRAAYMVLPPVVAGYSFALKSKTMKNRRGEHKTGSVLAGLFLLVIGVGAILKQTFLDFPSWVTTWPMILVAVGIFVGLKHGFRGPGWIILIGLGCIFLADKVVPGVNLQPFIWPFVIIALGLVMIFGSGSRKRWLRRHRHWEGMHWGNKYWTGEEATEEWKEPVTSGAGQDDFIDSTAILGNAKKVIFSKDFKGGDITNFFGGTEINCSQADINGRVRMDITQVFGGTKLIVPPHWTIKSSVTSIFGGFEDKRTVSNISQDPGKVLVIDGTSVFGGIEIKSY